MGVEGVPSPGAEKGERRPPSPPVLALGVSLLLGDWSLERRSLPGKPLSSFPPKPSPGSSPPWHSLSLSRTPVLALLACLLVAHGLWTLHSGARAQAQAQAPPQSCACASQPPERTSGPGNRSDTELDLGTSRLPPLEAMAVAGEKCSTPQLEQLREHLRTVVLVINFNDAGTPWSTVEFLRTLYGRFFLEVVFIGPRALPSLGVTARSYLPWRKSWRYWYYHFPAVVAKYPEAEGYLWMNQDVVLNYFQLLNADKSKLWLPDTPKCWRTNRPDCAGRVVKNPALCRCQGFIPFLGGFKATILDDWSSTRWHRQLVRQAFGNLDEKFQKQHNRSMAPMAGRYQKRVVDIFYVPRRLSMALAFEVMPPFMEVGVWSEVAIPIMFMSLEHPHKYDPVLKRVVFKWGKTANQHPEIFWNDSQAAFHYRRQHTAKGKLALLRVLARNDPCMKIPMRDLSKKVEKESSLAQKVHGTREAQKL